MKAVPFTLVLGVALGALAGCRGQTSRETPIFGIRNMYDQPKYVVQSESGFFPDHRTMRPLVDGVVASDQEIDPEIARGRLADESGYVLETPKAIAARFDGADKMLERGHARYNIYCAPCHDQTGNGEGLVKKRAVAAGAGAFVPPSFHQDRIRHMPDGQLFATISNGKSNMPPYAMQIPVNDRWAIVEYVRALQLANPKLPGAAAMSGATGATGAGTTGATGDAGAAPADAPMPSALPARPESPAGSASAPSSAVPAPTPAPAHPEKKP